MSIAYGIIALVALSMIGAYFVIDRKRDIWLLLLVISVFICDLGYFLLSVSQTIEAALNANRLAYFGSVFLPFLLLMMILNLCKIAYRKWVPISLGIFGLFIFLIVASPGYLPIYYEDVSISIVNGTTHLVREYGPLHSLYYLYLFGYLGAMLAVIIIAIVKRKVRAKYHIAFLFCSVLINVVIWLAEQLIPRGFELLSASYVITESFILMLYGILQEYGLLAKQMYPSAPMADTAEKYLSGEIRSGEADSNVLFRREEIEHIFSSCEMITALTEREKEVLRCILANKRRKEIAEELFVTESTIKKYTASVFRKLSVANRIELFAKLRNYV